jgi:hypothetical protein
MNTRTAISKYLWLIILICIALYLLIFQFKSGTINPASRNFSILDTSGINQIILSNGSVTINLNRADNGWQLDNSLKVRDDAIRALMNVLTLIEIKSPIPNSVSDSLSRVVATKGINVELFCGSKNLKSYSILSTKTLGLGTIGKLKKHKKAFSLQLPGFKGNLASLFVLDPDYWKSNRLFIADITQIMRIDVEIPNSPEKSFSISLLENSVKLRATYFDRDIDQFDTSRVVDFIFGLTRLSYEKLLNKSTIEDKAAIVLSQPEQIFTITLTNSKRLVLKTYPIPVDEYRDEFGRTVKFDLNRLYISFNNDAILAIATYMVFDPVLKDLSSFRLKN